MAARLKRESRLFPLPYLTLCLCAYSNLQPAFHGCILFPDPTEGYVLGRLKEGIRKLFSSLADTSHFGDPTEPHLGNQSIQPFKRDKEMVSDKGDEYQAYLTKVCLDTSSLSD